MTKKILIASVNPWSFSMAAEQSIARKLAADCQVDAVNVFRLSASHSPVYRSRDRIIERLGRKYQRLLVPHLSGRDITREIRLDRSLIPPVPTSPEAVWNHQLRGAKIGLGVLSTLATVTTIQSPRSVQEWGKALPASWTSAHLSFQIAEAVADMGYDEVYLHNGRYCYARPLCDVLDRCASVFRYELVSAWDSYVSAPEWLQDASCNARLVSEHDFSPAEGEACFRERLSRAPGNEVAFFTANQVVGHVPGAATKGKTISFFPSSTDEMVGLWEGTNFGAFPSQFDVAMALARICRSTGKTLIVRLHPHLLHKNESWKREWDFAALRDGGAVVIDPGDPCDTYALVRASEAVVTCGSTVGFESAILGTPSASVGDWLGGRLGASTMIATEDELSAFVKSPALLPGAREAALRYGSYLKRAGTKIPLYDTGAHPYLARIDGKVVDPIRYGLQQLRSLFQSKKVPPAVEGVQRGLNVNAI